MKRLLPAIVVCALLTAVNAWAAPIRVLLLDGQSGGSYHNWKLTTPILQKELEETGLFEVPTSPAI